MHVILWLRMALFCCEYIRLSILWVCCVCHYLGQLGSYWSWSVRDCVGLNGWNNVKYFDLKLNMLENLKVFWFLSLGVYSCHGALSSFEW